jgi:hypothetical protein
VTPPSILLLTGKQAEAKLLELGLTQKQIDEMKEQAKQRLTGRQAGKITPLGFGTYWLGCGSGRGAHATFFVTSGFLSAHFNSSIGQLGARFDDCPSFCMFYHQQPGIPTVRIESHEVATDGGDPLYMGPGTGCN